MKFKAFSLVEVMITVAIIGILATSGIIYYGDYVTRSKVSEGLAILNDMKKRYSAYYAEVGNFPSTFSDLGLNEAQYAKGKYVKDITLGSGVITITFDKSLFDNVADRNLKLTGTGANLGLITWSCTSDDIEQAYLPGGCASSLS